jgi:hypothetical protein
VLPLSLKRLVAHNCIVAHAPHWLNATAFRVGPPQQNLNQSLHARLRGVLRWSLCRNVVESETGAALGFMVAFAGPRQPGHVALLYLFGVYGGLSSVHPDLHGSERQVGYGRTAVPRSRSTFAALSLPLAHFNLALHAPLAGECIFPRVVPHRHRWRKPSCLHALSPVLTWTQAVDACMHCHLC